MKGFILNLVVGLALASSAQSALACAARVTASWRVNGSSGSVSGDSGGYKRNRSEATTAANIDVANKMPCLYGMTCGFPITFEEDVQCLIVR